MSEAPDAAVSSFQHSGQGAFRKEIWVAGFGVGFALLAPWVFMGLTWEQEKLPERDARIGWSDDVAWQVFVPAMLWYIISVKVTGRVAYNFGMDMLQESNADIKECVRNNMTTAGVVLALVLTIVLAMLQAELPFEDKNGRIALWYRVLLVLATEACIKGVLTTSFFLLYVEPLNMKSAQTFTIDNINYVGEPVTCLVWSLLYFLVAMALWVFGMDGKYMGLFASALLCFVLVRTVVVMMYLTAWKNPDLATEERDSRKKCFDEAYVTPKASQVRDEPVDVKSFCSENV